jgi:hypothetical protein
MLTDRNLLFSMVRAGSLVLLCVRTDSRREKDVSNLRSFGFLAGLICACAVAGAAFAAAQTAQGPVPNFSSGDFPWVTKNGNYLPPPSGLGPLAVDKAKARTVVIPNNTGAAVQSQLRVADLNNPNLKPWVVDHLRKANEEELSGKLRYSARASCRPGGVPDFLVYAGAFQPIYIFQLPDKIVMVNQGNTEVRHIYLNVPHSANPRPSWYGESVGRYEGDELVVDTIGFNDKTFVDESFNLPHTTQLHVVERYKLLDEGTTLQVTFTVRAHSTRLGPESCASVARRQKIAWKNSPAQAECRRDRLPQQTL